MGGSTCFAHAPAPPKSYPLPRPLPCPGTAPGPPGGYALLIVMRIGLVSSPLTC